MFRNFSLHPLSLRVEGRLFALCLWCDPPGHVAPTTQGICCCFIAVSHQWIFCFTWKSMEPRPQTWLWFTRGLVFNHLRASQCGLIGEKRNTGALRSPVLRIREMWQASWSKVQKLLWRDKNLWCVQSLSKIFAHAQIFTVNKVFESTWTT